MAPDAIEALTMLPWRRAAAALGGRTVRLRMLTPPYPAIGVGELRCLRVRELAGGDDGAWELLAGYDGYVRP